MNFFFNAQFNYCLILWMLHSRSSNNKMKRLHEPCLRLIYSDKQSSYEELPDIGHIFTQRINNHVTRTY